MTLLSIWLIVINCLSFTLFGIDKYKAKHHSWRIKESTLFLSAVLGGGLGSFLGMKIFHHKTLKSSFKYGIPLIMIIWVIIIWGYAYEYL